MPFMKDGTGMFIPLAQGFEMYSPPSQFRADYDRAEETTFEGRRAIALVQEPKEMPNLRLRIFIDPESWLPVGSEQKMLDTVDVSIYRNVRTDRQSGLADFAWTPPRGAVDATKIKRDGSKLLQVGDVAPDFELPLTNGKQISLRAALKGKKGLLVNFWFINCGYCLLEMPEFEKLYRSTKDLELIAINDTDTADEVRKFVKQPGYEFPVAIDEGAQVAEAYKVKDWGHPITYLIRPDRAVAYVQVGFDTEKKLAKLDEELAKLGITRNPHGK